MPSPPLLTRRALLSSAALAALALPRLGRGAARPDLVFIFADDLRYDGMGWAGDPLARTPHIDRLAAEGAVFERNFVTLSLCAPSRAAHLTGLYPHTTGIIDNKNRRLADAFPTFPLLLQQAGYRTAFIGKWHMDDTAAPRPGFDRWVSFRGQGTYTDPTLNTDGVERVHLGYMTDLLTEAAVQFLTEPSDQPRMLFLSHKAVHAPFTPAPRHDRLLEDAPVPPPPRPSRRGQPAWVRASAKRLEKTPEERARLIRRYHETLMALDDSVGAVMEALGERLDQSAVIFGSDNGFFLGEHGLYSKMVPYEEALRVPLLVRYPPLAAPGHRVSGMTLNIDLAPTLLELGGAPPAPSMQGRSFVPLLSGAAPRTRERFLFELFGTANGALPDVVGLRTERHALVTAVDHPRWDELYDLSVDPEERVNLARREGALLASLRAELEEERRLTGWRRPAEGPAPRPYARTGGVVLHYNFQHDLGDRVIDDSGHDHEGLALGAPLVEVEGRPCRAFTGEDRVLVPRTLALDPSRGPWTAEVWVRAEDGVALARGGRSGGYALGLRGGAAVFAVSGVGGRVVLEGPRVAGAWARLTGVIGADRVARLYVDGALAASAPFARFLKGDPGESMQLGLDLGSRVLPGATPLRGHLARARLWSGEAPQDAITAPPQ